MALLSLAVLPIGCIAFWGMLRTSKTRMQPYYQASKQMNEAIVEYISGMEVIKVFGQTSASFRKYGESVKRYRQRTLEWFGVSWSFMAVYSVFLPGAADASAFESSALLSFPLPHATRDKVITAANNKLTIFFFILNRILLICFLIF